MHLNTRSIGLAVLLLLLFLGVALSLQWWVAKETTQLQKLAVDEARGRISRIIALSGVPPGSWDDYYLRELGATIGGQVQLHRTEVTSPPARTNTDLFF